VTGTRRKIGVVGEGREADAIAWLLCGRPGLRVARMPGSDGDELAGADVVVLAGGVDLERIAPVLAARTPDAVLVVALVPGAAACDRLLALTGFPRSRVLGVGGVVAAAALRVRLGAALGVAARDVTALALEDGTPLRSTITVAGTRPEAASIESALAAPATAPDGFAVASATAELVAAVADDERRVLPCVARCGGEYGIDGACATVPAIVGAGGIEAFVEAALGEQDSAALTASARRAP
jgi:malate dehydrogenase